MIKDAPEGLVQSDTFGVIKRHFVEKDEMVVQRWRDTQQFFEVTYPEHMDFAVGIFGLSVGLGVRVFVPCPLGKARRLIIVENSHQIIEGDVINIIPCEDEAQERIRRGMRLSYIPCTGALTITIRFRAVHRVDLIRTYMSMCDVVTDASVIVDGNQEEDYFPLHSDTLIGGVNIKEIN
jgi:hypothetical protein